MFLAWRSVCYIQLMTLAERRIGQRRAEARGGRRTDDPLPGKRCACEGAVTAIGAGRQFVWMRCCTCGEVWALRNDLAVTAAKGIPEIL
jgi:hypothetical protein